MSETAIATSSLGRGASSSRSTRVCLARLLHRWPSMPSRRATRKLCAALLTLVSFLVLGPPLAFEALYQVGLCGVVLPVLPKAHGPALALGALWINAGERSVGIVPLWLGNYSNRFTSPKSDGEGARAASRVAQLWLWRHQQAPPRHPGAGLSEAAIAVWLTRHSTAAQLQQAMFEWEYFGRNSHGLRAASSNYFGREPSSLSLGQLGLLIGILQRPVAYEPSCHPAAAARRRDYLLGLMVADGLISSVDLEQAVAEPIPVLPPERPCSDMD